jgi:hypothetical protein
VAIHLLFSVTFGDGAAAVDVRSVVAATVAFGAGRLRSGPHPTLSLSIIAEPPQFLVGGGATDRGTAAGVGFTLFIVASLAEKAAADLRHSSCGTHSAH